MLLRYTRIWLAWVVLRGLLHMCITNIRQRNLSTNKGYRATFTKAQVGKDLGIEAGQYGSFYKISLYPQCTDSKECLYLVGPHAGRRYSAAPYRSSKRLLNSLPILGAVKAGSVLCKLCSQQWFDRIGRCQLVWSQRWTVLTQSPIRNWLIWLSSVRPSDFVCGYFFLFLPF